MTASVVFFNNDLGYSSGLARVNLRLEGRHFLLHVSTGLLEEPFFFWDVSEKHAIEDDQNVTDDGYSDDGRHDENAPGNRGPQEMAQTRLECIDRGQSNDRYCNSEVTVPAHTQSVTPTRARVVVKLTSASR